jgi:tRNA pseudouridine38-40 synthase
MVRAIVGTLIPVGRGKLDPEGFEEIIKGRNRGLAGQSAPAHGLSLTAIEYPAELFI